MNAPVILSRSVREHARILSRLSYITDIDCAGTTARLSLSETGMPILLFKKLPDDLDSIVLPPFWKLDELCAKRTLKSEGQAFLITDILVRDGMCTYRTGAEMRERIRHKLENGIFGVFSDG